MEDILLDSRCIFSQKLLVGGYLDIYHLVDPAELNVCTCGVTEKHV